MFAVTADGVLDAVGDSSAVECLDAFLVMLNSGDLRGLL